MIKLLRTQQVAVVEFSLVSAYNFTMPTVLFCSQYLEHQLAMARDAIGRAVSAAEQYLLGVDHEFEGGGVDFVGDYFNFGDLETVFEHLSDPNRHPSDPSVPHPARSADYATKPWRWFAAAHREVQECKQALAVSRKEYQDCKEELERVTLSLQRVSLALQDQTDMEDAHKEELRSATEKLRAGNELLKDEKFAIQSKNE